MLLGFLMDNNSLLVTTAIAAGTLTAIVWWFLARTKNGRRKKTTPLDFGDEITSIEELRKLIPAGSSGSSLEDAGKVIDYMDDQMIEFLGQSPLVHIASCAPRQVPLVSPKGDEPGFCRVKDPHTLCIPERPGNNLVFGLQALLEYPKVGLCFQVPGNGTTLRIGGNVKLTRNARLCQEFQARGLPAKLILVVHVEYAFFHCSKAYIRSRLWQPDSWPKEQCKVKFGQYFTKSTALQNKIDNNVDKHYGQIQEAVDGKIPEPG